MQGPEFLSHPLPPGTQKKKGAGKLQYTVIRGTVNGHTKFSETLRVFWSPKAVSECLCHGHSPLKYWDWLCGKQGEERGVKEGTLAGTIPSQKRELERAQNFPETGDFVQPESKGH